ncbi:MAG: T9SS type A sorting domain-containing protein [Aliifodinibius sp.]|nr:T9SS type A sorting domain-containing protein [Fodinibius sp.]NIV15867.1 T9SS type A sorting domain-containing protein [Fodinibius sp.]NIY29805.1 T9SS type A sorting domain-containing protein [Fodinibius sp.]
MAQNYPNPFNSNTYISFYLPKRENISLTIYDLTGKEVIRLINPQMHASGEHEIAWNGINQTGKEVSSGIYLYELRAEGFKQVRKMLFIK